ncbi:hypothetical protein SDC9_204945 [bioreactor metagenome]|uniref:Uncharacterized protein n=1 Tax=bioreactor metagenome TaxID=1076179 RepID=A0A645J0Y5_9ZZZZ
MVQRVVDGGRQTGGGGQRNPPDHVADVRHQGEAKQTFDVVLGHRPQDPNQHGQQAEHPQQVCQRVLREQEELQPNQGVNPHLRQQACEHRRHRSGGGRVGVGKPGRQREDRRLDSKSHQQQ